MSHKSGTLGSQCFPQLNQFSACLLTVISSQGPVYIASRMEKERISIIAIELCSETLCVPFQHQDLVSTLNSWQLAITYLGISSLTKIGQAPCKQTLSGSPQWFLNTEIEYKPLIWDRTGTLLQDCFSFQKMEIYGVLLQ